MSQATASNTQTRLSGREAALARRQALSLYGKKAIAGGKPATMSATEARLAARGESSTPVTAPTPAIAEAKSCGCQHEAAPAAIIEYAKPAAIQPAPISAARQRRMELSLKGRGDAPPCRPCGRIRPEPQKVEVGTTLAGSTVTGNQVERTA